MYLNNNLLSDRCNSRKNTNILTMNNKDSQIVLAHELMKDATMGTFDKEKNDFYDMVLKKKLQENQF